MSARRRIMEVLDANPMASVTSRRTRKTPVAIQKTIGEIVDTQLAESFALSLLRRGKVEINTFRSTGHIHVSDLLGKCVRQMVLADRFNLSMPNKALSDGTGVTFAQGRAIDEFVKSKFVGGHPDLVYGRWSCICGGMVVPPMLRKKAIEHVCGKCNTVTDQYRELNIRNDAYDITGSPDVVLFLPQARVFYPIEIKSIAHERWKELVRPLPEHVLQVMFYCKLMLDDGMRIPNVASILYVTKGWVFGSPYKEFSVSVPDNIERLDDYLGDAKLLKAARDGGPLPPRTYCSNISCTTAKECHVGVMCFAHDE